VETTFIGMNDMNKPIADETIAQVLSKTDIVDIIGEYVHLKKSGRNFLGLCPFHAEKTPSFSVSSEKQFYHCFGCGAGGNVISFLMEIEGHSFPQAVQSLGEKVGIHIQNDHKGEKLNQQKSEEKEWMFKGHDLAAKLYHHVLMDRTEGQPAREYLEKRGFRLETIKEFQIGYAPDSWDFLTNFLDKRHYPLLVMEKGGLLAKSEKERFFDRFRDRIMFPIWDAQGNVSAFGGRTMGENQPKYLNSPETPIFHKSKLLFNFHRARQEIRKQHTTILFEGFADTISAWQGGIMNTTATMGTSLSNDQARALKRNGEQVVICYDGDQAGIDAISRAADVLENQGCLIKVATLPQGLDPDDYIRQNGSDAFQKSIVNEAKSFTAFRLDVLKRGRNLQDDGERMSYIREALTVVSRLPHAVERDHYLRQLADEFSLSLEALKQELFQIYRAEKKKENRDKAGQKWNNSINNSKRLVAKQLNLAFYNAERMLLAHMLKSAEVTMWVEEEVGSYFNIDEHSALAAYLYAFYAEGQSPDLGLFLSKLHDSELMQLATQLSMMAIDPNISEQVLKDYISQIIRYPQRLEIERKEEERMKAERQGDVLQAAHIATEILKLKKKL
jgi:DNA primase